MQARQALRFCQRLESLWGTPGFASATPAGFVKQAHQHSLQVTIFKDPGQHARRQEYAKLLEQFPFSTANKFGDLQLTTPEGRGQAVGQLVNKHSGEVVELDRMRASWVLLPVVPGSASAFDGDQWLCRADGKEADTREFEFGAPAPEGQPFNVALSMESELKRIAALEPDLRSADLAPHWPGGSAGRAVHGTWKEVDSSSHLSILPNVPHCCPEARQEQVLHQTRLWSACFRGEDHD